MHRASQRHRGARTNDTMNHLTASQERKRQPAQSHRSRDRARTMCGALAPNVRSSGLQCAELDALASLRSPRKFGVSEIRNFHHVVILRIFCIGWTFLSCPVLSCPVVTLVSDRCPNQCGRKADTMRTQCGHEPHWRAQNAVRPETRSFAAPSTLCRPPLARVGVRTRLDICPNQSGQNADEKRTDVRIEADKMRTGCGQDADAASPLERVACGVGGESLDAQRIESMADEVRRGRFCPNFPPHDPSRSGYLGERPSSSLGSGTVATPAQSVTCGQGPSRSVRVGQGPISGRRCFPS